VELNQEKKQNNALSGSYKKRCGRNLSGLLKFILSVQAGVLGTITELLGVFDVSKLYLKYIYDVWN